MAITPTLDNNELDNVTSIRFRKQGDIEEITLPGTDSSGNITFDFGGVGKSITVSGSYIGTTANIKADIDILAAILDGDQSESVLFKSDELGTAGINVKMISLDVEWVIPSNRANYTIQLVEGTD